MPISRLDREVVAGTRPAPRRDSAGSDGVGDTRVNKEDRSRDSRAHRIRSIDAIRGLAIVIMLLAGNPFPREHLWQQLRHPEWHGLSFADLFFPLFLFAMGAAMTLSRRAGSAPLVLRRAAILVVLGIALTSLKHHHLGLMGVLQHIAIAYVVAWLVLKTRRRAQPILAAGILGATWLAYLLWAPPGGDPWGQEGSFAHAASRAISGGFSPEGPVQSVTSAVNVLAGAFVARAIKQRDASGTTGWLLRHTLWILTLAVALAVVIPINKKIWTPSFAVLTIATSCVWLAMFVWVSDVKGWRASNVFEQLGANPIVVYVVFMTMTELVDPLRASWPRFELFGSQTLGTTVYGLIWVGLAWLFARWLYHRRIFLAV